MVGAPRCSYYRCIFNLSKTFGVILVTRRENIDGPDAKASMKFTSAVRHGSKK
jgi:hypothetical protein